MKRPPRGHAGSRLVPNCGSVNEPIAAGRSRAPYGPISGLRRPIRRLATSCLTKSAKPFWMCVLYEESRLPARPSGKPYQGLENPPRRRSHLVPQSHCQPVPAVPARRRLLAAVEPAGADAQALVLAGRPVRHAELRLIKTAARIVEMKTKTRSLPPRRRSGGWHLALGRLPRLISAGESAAITRSPNSPIPPPAAKAGMRGHNPKTRQTAHQKTLMHRGA